MIGSSPGLTLGESLRRSRSALVTVAWLSAIINVLLLGGPIYMMLIYDSVMPSGSMPTLFGLLAMIAVVYAFQGGFDLLRSRILADVAASFDERMTGQVHGLISRIAISKSASDEDGLVPMRDLDAIRAFLASPGPGALIDLPWMLLFLGLLTLLHVWLGLTAFVGAAILVGLTALNDRFTRGPSRDASRTQSRRSRLAQDNARHVELIRALGMGERMQRRWIAANADYNATQDRLTRVAGTLGGASRIFRMFLQSIMLTVGALLYLSGEASGGIVFASSILSARALAPIDQAIANWRGFTAARQGWQRLEDLLERFPAPAAQTTRLPRPAERLQVEAIATATPGGERPILREVSFTLEAGEALGIVGPSAAGKTTLARAIAGLWPLVRGSVRLDGADIGQWDTDDLGRYLGYLPQQVELFDGTIAENIARMQDDPSSDAVIAAARGAGVHDLIVHLPDGYDTRVGAGGSQLSAGQRQRIGLARAIFGDPFLVVLDEPNSNLDAEGEAALDQAIAGLRARGAIVVLIAHRPAALRQVSQILVLQQGQVTGIGERDEMLQRMVVGPNATPLRPRREHTVDERTEQTA